MAKIVTVKKYNLRKHPKKGDRDSGHTQTKVVFTSISGGYSENETLELLEAIDKMKKHESLEYPLQVEEDFYLSFLKNRGYPYEFNYYDRDGNEINPFKNDGVLIPAWDLIGLLKNKYDEPRDKGVSLVADGLMVIQSARKYIKEGDYKAVAETVAQLPVISRSIFSVMYEIQIQAGRHRTDKANATKAKLKKLKKNLVIELYNSIKKTNPNLPPGKVKSTILKKVNEQHFDGEKLPSPLTAGTLDTYLTEARRDKEIDC